MSDRADQSRPPPLYTSRLVGRVQEQQALAQSLSSRGLITVTGPAGIGKTRLVSDVLRGLALGAVFVDAEASFDEASLLRAMLRDLRWKMPAAQWPEPTDDLPGAVAREITGRQRIVLDHIDAVDSSADILERLLAAHPDVTFLVTSSIPTGARGERCLALEPLRTTDEADLDDAIGLFLRSLPRLGALPIDPVHDRTRLRTMVADLGGNPLGIELAAGHTALLPTEALAQPGDREEERPYGALLTRAIEVALGRLPEESRAVLVASAVFAGPFSLRLAREVIETKTEITDIFQQLIGWHLARTDIDYRVTLQAPVRDLAGLLLAQRDDRMALFERHAEALLKAARSATLPEQIRLAAEIDLAIERAREGSLALRRTARELTEATRELQRHLFSPSERYRAVLQALASGPLDLTSLSLLSEQARLEGSLGIDPIPTLRRLYDSAAKLGEHTRAAEALVSLSLRSPGDEALAARALTAARAASLRKAEIELLGNSLLRELPSPSTDEEVARIEAILGPARGEQGLEALTDALRERLISAHIARMELAKAQHRLGEPRGRSAGEGYALLEQILSLLQPAAKPVAPSSPAALALAALGRAMDAEARQDGTYPEREEASARIGAAGQSRQASAMALLLSALGGGPGEPSPPDPELEALHEGAAIVAALSSGGISPELALQRFSGLRRSPWLSLLGRRLERERERLQRSASAWRVAADGSRFQAPSAAEVSLPAGARLARMLAALCEDARRGEACGLDVIGLFEAGWPGEEAPYETMANRVRVAVTTLRKQGLTILAWDRSRGWFLDAPLLIARSHD